MKDKDQVGADIYIEDNPQNVEALRAKDLYTICYANSTNKHIDDPRAENWERVYELVREWVKNHPHK